MSVLLPLCILVSILAQRKRLCKKNAGNSWFPGNLVQVAKKRRSIFDIRRKRSTALFRQASAERTVSGIRKAGIPAQLFCQEKPESFPAVFVASRPRAGTPACGLRLLPLRFQRTDAQISEFFYFCIESKANCRFLRHIVA